MFDQLFDLPAHPLLIHAPIVLLPIAAIATIVLAIKPDWRQRAGWFPLIGIFVVTVLLFGAKESGEALSEAYDSAYGEGAKDLEQHVSLADMTFFMTLAWLLVTLALTVWEFRRRRAATAAEEGGDVVASANPYVSYVLSALATLLAVLATIWLIRTGHEGADVVWSPQMPKLYPEG